MLKKTTQDFQQGQYDDMMSEFSPTTLSQDNPDANPENSPNAYATKLIDRFNAFDNTTENRNYNSDYRTIVPQISVCGCEIPEVPASHEKKSIRKVYNSVGAGMLIHFAGTQILAFILMIIVQMILMAKNGGSVAALQDITTATQWITDYINNSSIMMALNLFACMTMNLVIFGAGCKITKVDIKSLFCTEGLNNRKMIMYILIALFIQFAGDYIYMFISYIMSLINLTPYTPDFSTGIGGTDPNIRQFMIVIIYTCIIAPITEELLIRGFVLKNMSRVSQKFGIIVSALIFALIHENIAQGILAFFVGLLMGYVVIKHNSLVPSIIIHIAVNTTGMIWSVVSELFAEETVNFAYLTYGTIVSILGLIMLIYLVTHNKFYKKTTAQKKRCWPIIITSWSFILVTICHIGMTLFSILAL